MGKLRPMDIERIRELDIVDYAKSKMKLKQQGANHVGLCPFHGEKTPSFMVSGSKNIYKCFGCDEGGSIIDLAMHFEGEEFHRSCKILAAKYGIEIVEMLDAKEGGADDGIERAIITNNAFQQLFVKDFFAHRPVKEYVVNKRGYKTKEEVELWGLGYCKGDLACSLEDSEFAGLISKKGNLLFRDRLTFPIHDSMGNLVGFSARTFGASEIKYINTKENIAFKKSKILYNLHRAKKAIKNNGQFMLVEGPTDVQGLHRLGVRTSVASCGTSFTDEQCRLLANYSKNGYLMKDGDKAGRKSAVRDCGIFWKHGFKITVIQLPFGEDPGSMVDKYGSEMDKYCMEFDSVEYVYNFYLDTLEDVEKAIKKVISMIADCKSRFQREVYLKKLAFVCDFSIESLFPILKESVSKAYYGQRMK